MVAGMGLPPTGPEDDSARGPNFNLSVAMLLLRPFRRPVLVLHLTAVLFVPLRAANWPAIDPADLTLTASAIDPDAVAEVLRHETTIDDSFSNGTDRGVYRRIKTFNRAGVEKYSVIDIPFVRGRSRVRGIEARTIKPDGTTVELNPKDVYEREIVRINQTRVRVKSFAPPGLEPGAIVEYRYRLEDNEWNFFYPLTFNDEVPTRSSLFKFRPFAGLSGLRLQSVYMNTATRDLKQGAQGYYEFAQTDIPALPEEPFQPPQSTVASSILIYYTFDSGEPPDKYWKKQSRDLFDATRRETKAAKELTERAQRLVAGAATDDEKLQRLHDYCRTAIVNRSRRDLTFTEDERKKFKSNDSAVKTLRAGYGTRSEINTLFVALARAVGFDARLALGNDRSYFPANRQLSVPFIFTDRLGAVQRDGKWQFFDPGAAFLPAGMVAWRNADTLALIADEKAERMEMVTGARAEQSLRHRTARLTVADDGALEGEMTWRLTGHFEAGEKVEFSGSTNKEIIDRLRGQLEPMLRGAELSDVKVTNADRTVEAMEISFRVRVPGFAERTGSRLFVQPSVFRRNARPIFASPERKTAVVFHYRASEFDDVEITLPNGFVIESGHSPAGLDLGRAGNYAVTVHWDPRRRMLRYERAMTLNAIGFVPQHYAVLRDAFDTIQDRDDYTLTFRLEEPAAAEATGAPAS